MWRLSLPLGIRMHPSPLAGLQVLLVEDEPIIALGLQGALEQAGAQAVSLAHTVEQAMALIDQSSFDVAVLDFRLQKETSTPIAARLSQLNVPYLFHTSAPGEPASFHPGISIMDKPTRPEQLVAAVAALAAKR
jgi:DNA-binding response OmpR family regulator